MPYGSGCEEPHGKRRDCIIDQATQTKRDLSNWRTALAAAVMLALIVALCVAMLAVYNVRAFDGVDENGYLCTAKRMVLTGDTAKHIAHPLEYVSDNVVRTRTGALYAKYPLGYPWLCALGYWLLGPAGVFLVNPVLAIAAVIGMFFLARAMVNTFAGILAAILVATNPWHLVFGISSDSHAGAIAFAIWGMYFLWRWAQTGGRANAIATGVCVAYAYTVRYSEALLAVPVLAIVVWRYFQERQSPVGRERRRQIARWRLEVTLLGLAVLVTILPLLAHHWIAFGGPFRTGYGLCGESTGFGWKWFQVNWWLMLTKINTSGLFFIFPVGLAGLGYVAAHDKRRALLLGLWCGPSLLLYTAYYWVPDWEGAAYLRFFVSVFPAIIIGALILLCEVVKPRPLASIAVGALVAVTTTFNLRLALTELGKQCDRTRSIQLMCESVRQHAPSGAIIVAGADALNSLEYVGDYELYSAQTFDRNLLTWRTGVLKSPALNEADPHAFQLLKAKELDNALGKLNNGQLAALERSLLASNVAAGRVVTVLTTPAGLRSFRGRMGEAFRYATLTEWCEFTYGKEQDPRAAVYALYQLQPAQRVVPAVETTAEVEAQMDQQQFRVATMREEYDDQYPGARQKWTAITEAERQLQVLRDKSKQRSARPPVATGPRGSGVTNAPAHR